MSGTARQDDPPSGSRDLTDADGSVDESAVKDVALPVLERWESDRSLDAIRGRVGRIAAACIAVVALSAFVEFDGLAGFVYQLWFYASLPVGVVASATWATLRDPTSAREVWWDDGALAALGLVVVAYLYRSSEGTAWGRAAWKLLFAEDSPTRFDYGYEADDDVDEAQVREYLQLVRYGLLGSLALFALDLGGSIADGDLVAAVVDLVAAFAGDGSIGGGADGGAGGGGGGLPALPAIPTDPVTILGLLVLAVVVGAVVGLAIGIRRQL